jgi:hypothetical protein
VGELVEMGDTLDDHYLFCLFDQLQHGGSRKYFF